jgi:DNA-binding NarL/FixJ family response regulator
MTAEASSTAIRILIVDDHPVVREGLAAIISTQADMRVVGQAGSGEEAMTAFASLSPDVTLMDLRLPDTSGIDLAGRVQARWPGTRIIMFTSFARGEEVYEALKAGAWSYIRKGAARPELLSAIRSVHAGQRYISPDIGRHLADHVTQNELSAREREVLAQMFEGKSNKEIGKALTISEHTVNIHVKNILSKLGASGRTEAVTIALRKGLLHVD